MRIFVTDAAVPLLVQGRARVPRVNRIDTTSMRKPRKRKRKQVRRHEAAPWSVHMSLPLDKVL